MDNCGAIVHNFTVYLADSDALRGSLVFTLRKSRRTVLVTAPRVFGKLHERLLRVWSLNGPVKSAVTTWSKDVSQRASLSYDGSDVINSCGYQLANFLVFENVREALGLDAAKIIINALVPLQNSTDKYFKSLSLRIVDLYGLSEATGPLTLNYPDYPPGTSGKVFPGTDLKLVNKIPDGEEEPCFCGRSTVMGYLNNAKEIAKTMDDEGFIDSGDIGCIDADGFITITRRAKELIVTAVGDSVSPILVKTTLVTAMPALRRALLFGDKRKITSTVLILQADEEGKLIGPAAAANPDVKTVHEAVNDTGWQKHVNTSAAPSKLSANSWKVGYSSKVALYNDHKAQ